MNNLIPIDPADLVPMDLFLKTEPLTIDVMYAGQSSFCGIVYKSAAPLSLHRDMAEVVVMAARLLYDRTGGQLELYDGLRTTTAQRIICETPIVKAHPHWTAEGPLRMFAPPGQGGHPRGMAIDLSYRDVSGALVDMGTVVDALPEGGADRENNPAHREYIHLASAVEINRADLTCALTDAADWLGRTIRPLPSEWWDYRFTDDVYGLYAALADEDVPPSLRLTNEIPDDVGVQELHSGHYEALAEKIFQTVSETVSPVSLYKR